ncbi:SusE domain-containing protein [Flavobacterium branchiicola]|uniref:SusE domain-containing protein n=1 Tax=Flavobacterium branchiicola TaxID=1114875 RepID=A0ABV9PAC1_9FLAO|nr:SusE domain-containing protein [Flavobacterium branchiicola]MBS7252944.1 SusE domain-containing protein [Flavobacterium branchiicola]
MKKLTFLLLGLLAFSITSCSDDDPDIIVNENEKITTLPVLEALPAPAEFVSQEDVNEDVAAGTFKWSAAKLEYNGPVSYYIQIAPAGSDFSSAVDVFSASVSVTTKAFTFGDLNLAVNRLSLALVSNGKAKVKFGTLAEFDVRVKAIAEKSEVVGYSTTQLMKINAYEKIIFNTPELFLVGAPQAYYGKNGWDEKNGISLKYIGKEGTKLFEAFVKVNVGDGFKFTGDGKTWANGNYGTDGEVAAISGGQEFTLIDGGASKDLKIAEADGAGLYYVRVDMDAMKVKVIKMNWGVIGAATAGGWNDESAMGYDFASNTYSYAGTDITAGEMKFRSKNTGNFINGVDGVGGEWTFNVGDLLFVGDGGTGKNFNVTAGAKPKLTVNIDGTAVVSGL